MALTFSGGLVVAMDYARRLAVGLVFDSTVDCKHSMKTIVLHCFYIELSCDHRYAGTCSSRLLACLP